MEDRTFLIAIFGLFTAACFIAWTLARTLVRLRQPPPPLSPPDVEARLARIEAAVEAIAIEVERNGELQRFNAKMLATGARAEDPLSR